LSDKKYSTSLAVDRTEREQGHEDPCAARGKRRRGLWFFRQRGAADWLLRASFAGTALGGAVEPERSGRSIAVLAGKAWPVTGCAHEE